MKTLFLSLGERRIGTVKVDRVRGRETWIFSYDQDYLDTSNPIIDPALAARGTRW